MKRILFSAAVPVAAALLLASCMQIQKLPKRYKSISVRSYPATKDSIKYYVGVSGYAYPVPEKNSGHNNGTPAKNVFSLSGEGQKQLIESIADNEESTEDIYNKLAMDITPATRNQPMASGVGRKIKRRIVLAVDDMHVTPADEVQKLTITVTPPAGSNIKMAACSKLVNNYNKPGKSEDGTVMRPVAMSSVVTPDGGLVITVDNIDGNAVTGNITADVTLVYSGRMNSDMVFTFTGLWGRDGSAVKPNNIVAHHHQQQAPGASTTGTFAVEYEGVVRHVAKGDNTISESDDVIEMIKGKTQAGNIEVVKDSQMKPRHWTISDGVKHLNLGGALYNGALAFDSYEEAQDFIAWLKRSSADILANNRICNGDYKIIVSGESGVLTDSFIENCQVTGS